MSGLITPNVWKKIDKQHSDDQFELSTALAQAEADRDRFAARLQRYDAIIDAQPTDEPELPKHAHNWTIAEEDWNREYGRWDLAEQLRKARQE